jgi:hypothetical protein
MPLMYLPPQLWPIFGVFLVCNIAGLVLGTIEGEVETHKSVEAGRGGEGEGGEGGVDDRSK